MNLKTDLPYFRLRTCRDNALFICREILGGFGDSALLFSFLFVFASSLHVSSGRFLLSTGIVTIVASLFFRFPIPVQPLKSLAISAMAMSATFLEVRVAAIILSVLFLISMYLFRSATIKMFRSQWIALIQAGLGGLLILQGLNWIVPSITVDTSGLLARSADVIVICSAVYIGFSKRIKKEWILGLIAVISIGTAIQLQSNLIPDLDPLSENTLSPFSSIRWLVVMQWVIPQYVLTLANSVIATEEVLKRNYPRANSKVTHRKLLMSLGFGNVLVGLFGGMPFCHGSSGVTALKEAGAKSYVATLTFGFLLLLFALLAYWNVNLGMPIMVQAFFFIVIGIAHFQLAFARSQNLVSYLIILGSVAVTLGTKNLLFGLLFGVGLDFTYSKYHRRNFSLKLGVKS